MSVSLGSRAVGNLVFNAQGPADGNNVNDVSDYWSVEPVFCDPIHIHHWLEPQFNNRDSNRYIPRTSKKDTDISQCLKDALPNYLNVNLIQLWHMEP